MLSVEWGELGLKGKLDEIEHQKLQTWNKKLQIEHKSLGETLKKTNLWIIDIEKLKLKA